MELGIIGLPTCGKTTIFNALTRSDRPTAAATTGKLEIHSATVDVPDPRVDLLSGMYNPRKTVYAKVTYTDIAGLDKGIDKSGLSGQLRNQIARMDAFVHVVRAFEDEHVPHLLGSIDPQRDLNNLDDELLLADLVTVENRLQRIDEGLKKGARGDERKALDASKELFLQLKTQLEEGKPLRNIGLDDEIVASLSGYSLLTLKPVLVLINAGEDTIDPGTIRYEHQNSLVMSMQGKIEMEMAQLEPDEAEMFMEEFGIEELSQSKVIRTSYELLKLQSFFTVGEDEVRAWRVKKGATAVEAAGTIHTDLARGFIRAEVVAYEDLISSGNMAAARKAAQVRLEGKEYEVQDGDIVHIRFSI